MFRLTIHRSVTLVRMFSTYSPKVTDLCIRFELGVEISAPGTELVLVVSRMLNS